jgi:hypothetical protein
MQYSRFLIPALLVTALLAVAGCTTTGTPPVTATATPPVTLASLALAPSDVPANYTLAGSREKNQSEMGPLALQLGWEGGYIVTYTNDTVTPYGQTTIVQTITRYPVSSMPGITGLVRKQEMTDVDMDYTNLSVEGLGDLGGGYLATPHTQILIKPVDSGNAIVKGSAQAVMTHEIAEVWFSKGEVFEVIRVTGPGADRATVTSLARAAYAKCP